jgi:hypothetical protein
MVAEVCQTAPFAFGEKVVEAESTLVDTSGGASFVETPTQGTQGKVTGVPAGLTVFDWAKIFEEFEEHLRTPPATHSECPSSPVTFSPPESEMEVGVCVGVNMIQGAGNLVSAPQGWVTRRDTAPELPRIDDQGEGEEIDEDLEWPPSPTSMRLIEIPQYVEIEEVEVPGEGEVPPDHTLEIRKLTDKVRRLEKYLGQSSKAQGEWHQRIVHLGEWVTDMDIRFRQNVSMVASHHGQLENLTNMAQGLGTQVDAMGEALVELKGWVGEHLQDTSRKIGCLPQVQEKIGTHERVLQEMGPTCKELEKNLSARGPDQGVVGDPPHSPGSNGSVGAASGGGKIRPNCRKHREH